MLTSSPRLSSSSRPSKVDRHVGNVAGEIIPGLGPGPVGWSMGTVLTRFLGCPSTWRIGRLEFGLQMFGTFFIHICLMFHISDVFLVKAGKASHTAEIGCSPWQSQFWINRERERELSICNVLAFRKLFVIWFYCAILLQSNLVWYQFRHV